MLKRASLARGESAAEGIGRQEVAAKFSAAGRGKKWWALKSGRGVSFQKREEFSAIGAAPEGIQNSGDESPHSKGALDKPP